MPTLRLHGPLRWFVNWLTFRSANPTFRIAPTSDNEHEALCNAIAAEVLVPWKEFATAWAGTKGTAIERINKLRQQFGVGGLVIARRPLGERSISR
jgi:Zn-dependent peptidase ImmA (M78 family)